MAVFNPNQAMPDFEAQQLEVERQRRVADYLRKQVTTQPETRMVGRVAVQPHWLERLVPLLNQYQAGEADRSATTAAQNASNQQSQAADQWRNRLPQATPAIPGTAPVEDGYLTAEAPQAAAPVDRQRILKYTLEGLNNPRTAKEAAIVNQSLTGDLTRQEDKEYKTQERIDTEAWRAGESAIARAGIAEQKAVALAQQKWQIEQQMADKALSREQQAVLAKQHNTVLLAMNAATNEARVAASEARGTGRADKKEADAEKAHIAADERLQKHVQHLSTAGKDFVTLREAAGSVQELLDNAPLKPDGTRGNVAGLGREGLFSPLIRTEEGNVNRQKVQKFSNAMLRAQAGLSQTLSEQEKADLEVMSTGKFTQKEFERSWPSSMSKLNASLANLRAGVPDEAHTEYQRRGGANLSDVIPVPRTALPKATTEQMPPGMDPKRWARLQELRKSAAGGNP